MNSTLRFIPFHAAVFAAALIPPIYAQDPTPSRDVRGQEKAAGTQVLINEINTDQFPKIRIFGTVLKDGQPVKGLGADDFRVREDEREQGPLTVEPKLPPLTVVLTLDTSGSMAGKRGTPLSEQPLTQAKEAATSFLDQLGSGDTAQVVTFAQTVSKPTVASTNREAVRAAIAAASARGNTALYDGLHRSIELLHDRPGRKAIVLLSDGVDDDGHGRPLSTHKVRDILSLARTTNIPIYVIGLGSEIDEGVLQQIASETGGVYFNAPEADKLQELYAQIGEQLAGQYSIIYSSDLPAQAGERTVVLEYPKLKLSNSKAFVPANRGPGPSPSPSPNLAEKRTPPEVKTQEADIPDWVPVYGGVTPQKISVFRRRGAISGYYQFESGSGPVTWYAEKLAAKGYKVTPRSNLALRAQSTAPERTIVVTYLYTGDIDVRFEEQVSAGAENTGGSLLDQIPEWVPIYPGAIPANVKVKPSTRSESGSYSFPAAAASVAHVPIDYFADALQAKGFEVKREHTRLAATSGRRSVTATNQLNGHVVVTFDEEK